MSDYTILLVDYDPDSAARLCRPLVRAGYRVEVATDGLAGISRFHELEPDLTLIEAMIPKKHGFEALVLHHEGVTPEKASKIKAAGIEVGAWTVNEAAMMERMLDAGVERLYTDRPRSLLSLKAERLKLRAISN